MYPNTICCRCRIWLHSLSDQFLWWLVPQSRQPIQLCITLTWGSSLLTGRLSVWMCEGVRHNVPADPKASLDTHVVYREVEVFDIIYSFLCRECIHHFCLIWGYLGQHYVWLSQHSLCSTQNINGLRFGYEWSKTIINIKISLNKVPRISAIVILLVFFCPP